MMFMEDYHLHTEFSDDSFCAMQKQAQRAIELGIDEICFTDHVDYGIKIDWDDRSRIRFRGTGEPLANVDYPVYFNKLDYMREIYGDQVTIRNGLEFGIQVHTIPQFQKLFDRYKEKLDFVLLSCHQVEDKEFWTQDYQKGRTQKEYNERYYQEIYEVMKAYKDYSVVAHLDLLSRYDEQGIYPFALLEEQIAEILKQAISDGKGLEINTSSYKYKLPDLQPSKKILKLYKDLGGTILTIGSDAHVPDHLGDKVAETLLIAKEEFGFMEVYTFEKMKPIGHLI